ncbi:MAG: response regulator transcription factor [Candidatus Aminicenantes bacterium]|nr:MAG: response regulator transcription factor [Candidatus Aminicenantes bacterium]
MEYKYKIAVVEDEELIRNMVKINLEKNNYRVHCFADGETLIERAIYEPFDLFILDVLLPGISGLDVLEELRKTSIHAHVPVLMLTVQSQVQDKIKALNTGADDYLVKPFNIEELLARVNALIRRSHGKRSIPSDQILIINNYKIDLSTRVCQSNKGEVVLSEKEIKLLKYFSLHPEQTLRRADILEEVWGMDVSPTPRTIDNFILKFRKLFETNPEKPRHFISVRNKGYRLRSATAP